MCLLIMSSRQSTFSHPPFLSLHPPLLFSNHLSHPPSLSFSIPLFFFHTSVSPFSPLPSLNPHVQRRVKHSELNSLCNACRWNLTWCQSSEQMLHYISIHLPHYLIYQQCVCVCLTVCVSIVFLSQWETNISLKPDCNYCDVRKTKELMTDRVINTRYHGNPQT